MLNFSIIAVSLCVRQMSPSLKRVLSRDIGLYFFISIRSDGLGIKIMFRLFTSLSSLLPVNICSLIALRIKFGHILANHSSNLEEMPSGPPALDLFSFDSAF